MISLVAAFSYWAYKSYRTKYAEYYIAQRIIESYQNNPSLDCRGYHHDMIYSHCITFSFPYMIEDFHLRSHLDVLPSEIAELTDIKSLVLDHTSINDISAVSNFQKLESIAIAWTPISDYSVLKTLPSLKYLSINGWVEPQDLEIISQLPNLERLYLKDSSAVLNPKMNEGIQNLSSLNKLELLSLDIDELSDIRFVSKFEKLETIALRDCSKSIKLDPLLQLRDLKEIELYCDEIEAIEMISQFKNIKRLTLPVKGKSNLSFLENLTNLEQLFIEGCDDIDDLSPLAELRSLKVLQLRCNKEFDYAPIQHLLDAGLADHIN